MSGKKTLIAVTAAVVLGTLGVASVAQASDSGEEKGGFVMPGSMDGVNPVYHPDLFGKAAQTNNAGDAYGYALPTQKHRTVHHQTQGR